MSSNVELQIRLPPQLRPTVPAAATVTITNASKETIIVPARLVLEAESAVVARWDLTSPFSGAGQITHGRVTGDHIEVYVGAASQHLTAEDVAELESANAQFVRFAPLLPDSSTAIDLDFSVANPGRLSATLTYGPLEAELQTICVVNASTEKDGFVECARVRDVRDAGGQRYYIELSDLARMHEVAHAETEIDLEDPEFELAAARRSAGVSEGPAVYDPQTASWLLVDLNRGRTYRVRAQGEPAALPGNWLQVSSAMNTAGEATLSWSIDDPKERRRVEDSVAAIGIIARPFIFKDFARPESLSITVEKSKATNFANLLNGLSYAVDGFRIVRRTGK
jgi:hypothetical protein